jgi:cephalosporin-C deacetylase-like acetyl esterase
LNGAIYEIDAQNTRPKSEEGSLVLLLLYHGQDDPHNFKLEEFHWCIRTAGVFEAL